jgi:hypothetical protein
MKAGRRGIVGLVARVVLVTLVAMAAPACGSSSGGGSGGSSPAGSVAAAPALTSTGKAVPDPLNVLEESAEDIIDIAPGARWDAIDADVGDVDTAWTDYGPEATADGAPPAIATAITKAVAALHEASGQQQPAEVMQAANDLSAGVVELYGLYDTGRPVSIGRLDVIGRQIVLDADAKDAGGVSDEIAKAKGEWSAIEADIEGHDGQEVATHTNQLLDAMTAAAASGDLATARAKATELLEVVDDMESLY